MHFKNNRAQKEFFYKLAARNVRKSAKDYFIYFFTIMLSVALFYSFNSVSTQFTSLGLEDPLSYLSFSSGVLTSFSVLICMIMGVLVVYANRFLLKRRKKEMGIYATLGMERREINRLLMQENLCIGAYSLAAGLFLGVFAAQILSLITARLSGLSLANYRFMVSVKAIMLSILFFGILFFFVHLFHVKELKKLSLLEMLYAERKNETVSDTNVVVTGFLAVLSVALILGGYRVLTVQADQGIFKALGTGGLMLIAGTVFFFTSALRFEMKLRRMNKWYYYRGVNMFTTSQIFTRLKTEGRIIAMTAILLFLSFSLIIIGPGMGKYVMNGVENAAPYDGSISYGLIEGSAAVDPMEKLNDSGFDFNRFSDAYVTFQIYGTPSVMAGFLTGEPVGKTEYGVFLTIMGVEDYNRLLMLQGLEPVSLADDAYGINYAFPAMEKTLSAFREDPKMLRLGGKELRLAENGIWNHAWENRNALIDQGTLIVPQHLVKGLTPQRWVLDFNFKKGMEMSALDFRREWMISDLEEFVLWTRHEALISLTADNLLVTYLGLYLGITFLITAGAVLGLQQLSQSSDNVKRYELLEKLGVSKKARRKSFLNQLKVYFGFPFLLALVHSAVTVIAVFRNFEGMEPFVMISVTGTGVLFVSAVFAVYFISTYLGGRRILQI